MIMLDQSRGRAAPGGLLQGRRRTADRQRRVNVAEDECAASLAVGAILALVGISRASVPGLIAAAAGGALAYRGVSGKCLIYRALDVDTAQDQSMIDVTQTFTIDKPAEELYQFWRRFDNLPQIMTHLKSVRVLDEQRSHWVAYAPSIIGGIVEWDAEVVQDVPNERIAWRSLADSDVDHAGSVTFDRGPRGTIVRVHMQYVAPGGRLGSWVAKAVGQDPQQQIREDVRNFRRLMETGEIPTIAGQPHGACMGLGRRFSE